MKSQMTFNFFKHRKNLFFKNLRTFCNKFQFYIIIYDLKNIIEEFK